MWVDGKLCSYVEILGCQRHTASLSTGSLQPNRDRGVNREKLTLLSGVVVTITRRPVDLFSNSGVETSCVKSTSSHSLETSKQRATGEVCRTAWRSHQAHSPRLSSPANPSLVSS